MSEPWRFWCIPADEEEAGWREIIPAALGAGDPIGKYLRGDRTWQSAGQGPQGPQGPAGPRGLQGDPGPQGAPGEVSGLPSAFDFGVQYVHPSGSDSNDGFSIYSPKATIEAAYGDLSAGGTIMLASNQRHDIGDGLAFDRHKNCVITAAGRHKRNRGDGSDPATNAKIYSSTNATTLFDFTTPAASGFNAYGFEFSNVDVEVSPVQDVTVFRAPGVNDMRIVNCGFYHGYADANQYPFVVADADHLTEGDDSSWWRIDDNYVRGGQLVHAVGENVNQWVISRNVVFPLNQTEPQIYLESANRCVIRDNNFEGQQSAAAIYLKSTGQCRIDGNAGEATTVWVVLENSHGNVISDSGIKGAGLGDVMVRLIGTSANNLVLFAGVAALGGFYSGTDWLDNQAAKDQNWFITPSTSKTSSFISLPGLKVTGLDPFNNVIGKTGDIHLKCTSTAPPFISYKTTGDHGTDGWRSMDLGDVDSGGTGKRVLRGPN